AVFDHETPLFDSAPDDVEEMFGCKRLFDEIVCTKAHRFDSCLDIAMPRDHDDGKLRVHLLGMTQQIHAAEPMHLEVGHEYTREIDAERIERGRGLFMDLRLKSRKTKPLRDGMADRSLVVDEQDWSRLRHGLLPRSARPHRGVWAAGPSARRRPP